MDQIHRTVFYINNLSALHHLFSLIKKLTKSFFGGRALDIGPINDFCQSTGILFKIKLSPK